MRSGGVEGEVAGLLQTLIRNACVNDGSPASGGESRNADVLAAYLEGPGLDLQSYEPVPGRASLVARVEGRDPEAPSLLLMGHTDVVPASGEAWREDPFGGELVDGSVWGRGAVDMLNVTSSMAVAVRRLADGGWRPRGTLVYLAVADEEAMGTHGAGWLVEHEPEAVRADFVLTEFGGFRLPVPGVGDAVLPVMVAEKGASWLRLRLGGTAGHASMPFGADNALVKGAEAVRRIAGYRPPARLTDAWRSFVAAAGFADPLAAELLDAERLRDHLDGVEDVGLARTIHACTHTTFAPTVMRSGVKTNVVPDEVDLQVDVRTLPGQTLDDVHRMLEEALGDLRDEVEVVAVADDRASESPLDTPLWDSLTRATESLLPGARTVPLMLAVATDARFFRRMGATAYGYGLYGDAVSYREFLSMFHGPNERIDLESLRLCTELWGRVADDLLG